MYIYYFLLFIYFCGGCLLGLDKFFFAQFRGVFFFFFFLKKKKLNQVMEILMFIT
jgi:hypothetical protein